MSRFAPTACTAVLILAVFRCAGLSGTESTVDTPTEVARGQKQLSALQWVVPALTCALIVLSAFAGEQQRPSAVRKGLLARFTR